MKLTGAERGRRGGLRARELVQPEEEPVLFFDAIGYFKSRQEEILEVVYAKRDDPYTFLSNIALCARFMPQEQLKYDWTDWERARNKLKREVTSGRGGWTFMHYPHVVAMLDLFPGRRVEMLESLIDQIEKTEWKPGTHEFQHRVLMAQLQPKEAAAWMRKAKELLPEALRDISKTKPERTIDVARDILLAEPSMRAELQHFYRKQFDRIQEHLYDITDFYLTTGVMTSLDYLSDLRVLYAESAEIQPDGSVKVDDGHPKLVGKGATFPDRLVT